MVPLGKPSYYCLGDLPQRRRVNRCLKFREELNVLVYEHHSPLRYTLLVQNALKVFQVHILDT